MAGRSERRQTGAEREVKQERKRRKRCGKAERRKATLSHDRKYKRLETELKTRNREVLM